MSESNPLADAMAMAVSRVEQTQLEDDLDTSTTQSTSKNVSLVYPEDDESSDDEEEEESTTSSSVHLSVSQSVQSPVEQTNDNPKSINDITPVSTFSENTPQQETPSEETTDGFGFSYKKHKLPSELNNTMPSLVDPEERRMHKEAKENIAVQRMMERSVKSPEGTTDNFNSDKGANVSEQDDEFDVFETDETADNNTSRDDTLVDKISSWKAELAKSTTQTSTEQQNVTETSTAEQQTSQETETVQTYDTSAESSNALRKIQQDIEQRVTEQRKAELQELEKRVFTLSESQNKPLGALDENLEDEEEEEEEEEEENDFEEIDNKDDQKQIKDTTTFINVSESITQSSSHVETSVVTHEAHPIQDSDGFTEIGNNETNLDNETVQTSITYQEALDNLTKSASVKSTASSNQLVVDAPDPTANCIIRIFRPKLHANLLEDRKTIFALAKTKYCASNDLHDRLMQTLYRRFSELIPSVRSWTDIGFQNMDFSTDLRGTGLLGPLQMLWLIETYPQLIKMRLFLSNSHPQTYPFAIQSLNMTLYTLQGFRYGRLNSVCNTERYSVFETFNLMYGAMFSKFMSLYMEKEATEELAGQMGQVARDESFKKPTKEIEQFLVRPIVPYSSTHKPDSKKSTNQSSSLPQQEVEFSSW